MTPQEQVEHYLKIKGAGWRKSTLDGVSSVLSAYLKHHPDFSLEQYAKWVAGMKSGKLSPSTVNRNRTALSSLYNFGMKVGWFTANPDKLVPRAKLNEKLRPGRFITFDTFTAMMDRAKGTPYEFLISCGYYTGAAIVDCCLLEWECVNLDVPSVTINRRKTGTVQEVIFERGDHPYHLYAQLRYHLKHRLRRNAYVAPVLADRYLRSRSHQNGLRAIMGNYQFHDFRRTMHTRLAHSGIDPHIAGRIVGTKDIKVFNRYVMHNPQSIADAVKRSMGWEPPAVRGAS